MTSCNSKSISKADMQPQRDCKRAGKKDNYRAGESAIHLEIFVSRLQEVEAATKHGPSSESLLGVFSPG